MRPFYLGALLLLGSRLALADPLAAQLRAAGLTPVSPPAAAADFDLPDTQGRRWRLAAQRGRVVFLNFWATWCPPCVHEMPTMEALYQALRQRPFVLLAVNMQEDRARVAAFMAEHRLHFPALLDAQGRVSDLYRVRGLPTTYLLDCGGHVVGHAVGPRPWGTPAVHALLATLLADPRCQP
ncbi:MAG: hypothetical protein KatS3mg131_3918 [Candidatus Tectimicrobiota bacterium]|nr:MAG: hypothetical protein KatS3mg131_3918 [Candidatus Tectomicrobia bacterium]